MYELIDKNIPVILEDDNIKIHLTPLSWGELAVLADAITKGKEQTVSEFIEAHIKQLSKIIIKIEGIGTPDMSVESILRKLKGGGVPKIANAIIKSQTPDVVTEKNSDSSQ